MKALRSLGAIFFSLVCASLLSAQDNGASSSAALPNLVLLAHQEIQPGRAIERHKLEATLARACDHLDAPNSWIDFESFSGPREALFFDPFDSFEHVEQSNAGWRQFYAAHPDLARVQEEIDALVASERTVVAVRRDDLGYLTESIDLSQTRFMRVLEVRLFPGHESDFVEAFKILADAYTKIKAETPWVVYQANVGTPSPAFLIFVPMSTLKQNDDLLSIREPLLEAEGPEAADRLKQIARESYSSTESNLYVVSPEMSHVSKEFASGDPDFWKHKTEADAKPEKNPGVNPPKRPPSTKSKQQSF
jgi:hypothetical protein